MDSVHWTETHKRVKIEGKGNKFLAFKSSRDFLNCHHQPAVNYYANSIYLTRDLPLALASSTQPRQYSLSEPGPVLAGHYYNGRLSYKDLDNVPGTAQNTTQIFNELLHSFLLGS